MNNDEHRQRHVELHKALDELFADFIEHAGGSTTSTIMDLFKSSNKQAMNIDHGLKP